jgi:hypothetical protein
MGDEPVIGNPKPKSILLVSASNPALSGHLVPGILPSMKKKRKKSRHPPDGGVGRGHRAGLE